MFVEDGGGSETGCLGEGEEALLRVPVDRPGPLLDDLGGLRDPLVPQHGLLQATIVVTPLRDRGHADHRSVGLVRLDGVTEMLGRRRGEDGRWRYVIDNPFALVEDDADA